MALTNLALRLFLQLGVILGTTYMVGLISRRIRQPMVVAEMVAGILLGPSLLGWIAPGIQQWLFPETMTIATSHGSITIAHPSMSILYTISQVGIAIYMFLVGLEFDGKLLGGRSTQASTLAGAGIIVPFFLGIAMVLYLYRYPGLFGQGTNIVVAALFVGSALSITAFPVLARMLQEFALTNTKLGTLALMAASIDDVVCWCLLAIVLASFQSSITIALLAIGGALLYVAIMLIAGRRVLGIVADKVEQAQQVSRYVLIFVLLILMLSSWFTLAIGIHQVFGAFILGLVIPRGKLVDEIRKQFEPLTSIVLLPLFFVYSGLNTQIGLVNTPMLLILLGLILLTAAVGKFGGCTLIARLGGQPWRESVALGTLMNSRGLIELIMLNIGLQEHIITRTFFTILVIMAIVTTLIASPVFEWVYGRIDPLWKEEYNAKRNPRRTNRNQTPPLLTPTRDVTTLPNYDQEIM
jgi:Kef-type K+ transport system membrane component KefB